MNGLEILATVAGVMMSLAHYPQLFKIIKQKHVKDVSLLTYIMFFVGIIIWTTYGIILNNLPIILSFAVGLIGSAGVIIAYLVYR